MFGVRINHSPNRAQMERIIEDIRARRKKMQAQERASAITTKGEVVQVRSD